jgi:hypothetical protein
MTGSVLVFWCRAMLRCEMCAWQYGKGEMRGSQDGAPKSMLGDAGTAKMFASQCAGRHYQSAEMHVHPAETRIHA